MARPYREDIDWLRAVAVLSVLAFHWHVKPFGGGYIGVDIFFVISGFLITQIIQSEMHDGSFSFARFYERRVRRLLPALYVMVALAALPVFYFLLPSERLEFFKSLAAVVTFSSNIFFWQQSNYFERAADEKPLLHTWSLSVEEQFYLVLPVMIWAFFKWRPQARRQDIHLLLGLGALAVMSFAYSQWLLSKGAAPSAFFLSPPRAWEFLIGSRIAVEGVPIILNIHLRRCVRALGLILIAVPIFTYRDTTLFPGLAALWPCLGTALVIWAGIGSGSSVRAFWSPLNILTFFGKISYSLYLWHWPVFVYFRFSKIDLAVTTLEKFLLFLAVVAVSWLSHTFIEQPFRQRALLSTRRAVFAVAGCSSALLLLVSIGGIDAARQQNSAKNPLQAYDTYSYPDVYRAGTCFTGDWRQFDDKTCLSMQPGKANVLVWGDSLAAHYVHGLRAGMDPDRTNIMQATGEGCFPTLTDLPDLKQMCRGMPERVARFINENKPDLVVISANWSASSSDGRFDHMIANMQDSISEIRSRGIPIIVVGPSIQFRSWLPSMILRAQVKNVSPSSGDLLQPGLFALDEQMKARLSTLDGVTYLSVLDAACPQHQCPILLDGNVPLTWDQRHLTAEGSVFMARPIADRARQIVSGASKQP